MFFLKPTQYTILWWTHLFSSQFLIDWINRTLKHEHIVVRSLEQDLYDGLVLHHLLGKPSCSYSLEHYFFFKGICGIIFDFRAAKLLSWLSLLWMHKWLVILGVLKEMYCFHQEARQIQGHIFWFPLLTSSDLASSVYKRQLLLKHRTDTTCAFLLQELGVTLNSQLRQLCIECNPQFLKQKNTGCVCFGCNYKTITMLFPDLHLRGTYLLNSILARTFGFYIEE